MSLPPSDLERLADIFKVPADKRAKFDSLVGKGVAAGNRRGKDWKPPPAMNETAPKRGRPSSSLGGPNFTEPNRFILWLLVLAKWSGAKLTLDEKNGTGSLIDALNIFSMYFPANYFPASLNRLRRLKEMPRRIRLGKK